MEKKIIPQSIKDLAQSETLQRIMDRGQCIDDLASDLTGHWAADIYSRRPRKALLENGVLRPTDLDLASFLSGLVRRKAVINFPTYKSITPTTLNENQRVISKNNRHGQCDELVSNQEMLSFNVRILDQNVVNTDMVTGREWTGAYRTFNIVGYDGELSDAWTSIEFQPSAKENAFLTESEVWTDNSIAFKYFVHPNRWISIYGKYYFLSKAIIDRLKWERVYLRDALKAYPLPVGGADPDFWSPPFLTGKSKVVGEKVSKKFETLVAEVDIPFHGSAKLFCDKNRQSVRTRLKKVNRIINQLQFACRATELAFYKAGCKDKGFPSWIGGGTQWEHHKIKKTVWNRLVLVQRKVGEKALALRYRVKQKSVYVSGD